MPRRGFERNTHSYNNLEYVRPLSSVDFLHREDGVVIVELKTGSDKINLLLLNNKPFITSTTGPRLFDKLDIHDQELVLEAFAKLAEQNPPNSAHH